MDTTRMISAFVSNVAKEGATHGTQWLVYMVICARGGRHLHCVEQGDLLRNATSTAVKAQACGDGSMATASNEYMVSRFG